MVKEMKVLGFKIGEGIVVANLQVQTDRGVFGVSASLALNEAPELNELVPEIDAAIRKAVAAAGITPTFERDPEAAKA